MGKRTKPRTGYKDLEAYKLAEIICDATANFAEHNTVGRSETIELMVQAAQSAKQNIADGSTASGKSETELIGAARSSLQELLLQYQEFLKQNDLELWPKDHEKVLFIRKLAYDEDKSYETYKRYIEDESPETAANAMVCLILQATYLLDRLMQELE